MTLLGEPAAAEDAGELPVLLAKKMGPDPAFRLIHFQRAPFFFIAQSGGGFFEPPPCGFMPPLATSSRSICPSNGRHSCSPACRL